MANEHKEGKMREDQPNGANVNQGGVAVPSAGTTRLPLLVNGPVRHATIEDVQDAAVPELVGPAFVFGDVAMTGKPNRDDFCRVHPDPGLARKFYFLHDRENKDLYLVSNKVQAEIPDEVQVRVVYPYVDWFGRCGLWAVLVPSVSGKLDPWSRDAHRVAAELRQHWGRVVTKKEEDGYDVKLPAVVMADPEWPTDLDLAALLKRGYAGKFIDSPDHPLVRRLTGRIS